MSLNLWAELSINWCLMVGSMYSGHISPSDDIDELMLMCMGCYMP